MKKYVIILAAAVLGLVFSCNDKLDLTTDGRISRGEIFQDRYKIMGWLNGCYNYCPGVSLTRAGYTDETHHSDAGTSNGQNYYNFYQGSTSSSNWYGPDNRGSHCSKASASATFSLPACRSTRCPAT